MELNQHNGYIGSYVVGASKGAVLEKCLTLISLAVFNQQLRAARIGESIINAN